MRRATLPRTPRPVSDGSAALAEVGRVGAAVGARGRAFRDPDADVAERPVEDVRAVPWRVHPGADHGPWRAQPALAPADVLAERVAEDAAQVAGGAHARRERRAARGDVVEEVLGDHV